MLCARLQQARLAPGKATRQQHLAHLQQRHDTQAQRQCPRCGPALVLCTGSKGAPRQTLPGMPYVSALPHPAGAVAAGALTEKNTAPCGAVFD